MTIKKGDIYYADLTPVVGSEQGGIRPVLIIQNDIGNYYSPTVIAAAITSRFQKHSIPTHIQLEQEVRGLRRNSVILLEQVSTIDRMRLKRYIGSLNGSMMQKVDRAILISFGLKEQNRA
ncbi:type II toxin-antitoxin system PemK/MazF family toxin [Clostridium sp. AT4]|uniref:type II toxin-antitoxin system PemK/MazF family toxin n=1 Tax=Clostridium sp. AT4 TaxID=1720194 RepID=UPI00082F2A4A|nr:type II toxin-antitoxin system PemK/MazF family toxin [Clostridium sp. AT4]